MCGIVGSFAYRGSAPPVDREELRAVRDHMVARGPDGAGEWFSADGRVALGHRRLAIIDLSDGGAQPMSSADGRMVITFNGEIYNYRELKARLERRGRAFRSHSDTEVLLHLYEEYGTAMLGMLRGMFAFALWDARERRMLLARDAFGIKPLYYADDGATLRAASQVKALLRAAVDTSPEPAGHAGFLLWGSVPSPWTLYRGIRALPAGHFIWAGESGVLAPQPFCVVSDILADSAASPAKGTRGEALEAIAASLRSTIEAHLVSDVPVGAFLSAGIDSAVIAALMRERGVVPHSLTLGFAEYEGSIEDEVPHARALAASLGTAHDTVVVRQTDFESQRGQLLAAMDQPSIDGVNTWFVARAAASVGIKVALSGLGGDELFASYPSFRQVPKLARWLAPFARARHLGALARRIADPALRHVTSPKYAGLLEYGGTVEGAYLLRRSLYMPWELPRLMDPDMARAGLHDLQTMTRLGQTSGKLAGHERLALSALEMSWYMRHQLLVDADWAGMAHSLEIRVPFVDLDMLRECAPWLARYPDLTKQEVMRAAVPRLSSNVFERPKIGFNIPVRQWLGATSTSSRGLRGWSKQVLANQSPTRPHPSRRRVLVATLAPGNGGVHAMTDFAIGALEDNGFEPVVAYYATYGADPALSVPSFRLLQRHPGHRLTRDARNHEFHAIGAWLPELEFTHYLPTQSWRTLMDGCDAFLVVSGNALAATPFALTNRPYLAWIATDWDGDRRDRVRQFPAVRRLLDTCVNAPVIRRLERRLLRAGRVVALSEHTMRMLQRRAGAPLEQVPLPVPVDLELLWPRPDARVRGRIGFAGRFNDPRKNIRLLLEAAARLRAQGQDVHVALMGDEPRGAVRAAVEQFHLGDHVTFHPGLTRLQMRDLLQTLDVFVLPSHQEGLCISALEAMACGVPVVSTRCGGPEEFVISGVTGETVDANAGAIATAVQSLIGDEVRRSALAAAARKLVEDRYSPARAKAVFLQYVREAFPAMAIETATLPSERPERVVSA